LQQPRSPAAGLLLPDRLLLLLLLLLLAVLPSG
jgi:hypothetical protein